MLFILKFWGFQRDFFKSLFGGEWGKAPYLFVTSVPVGGLKGGKQEKAEHQYDIIVRALVKKKEDKTAEK